MELLTQLVSLLSGLAGGIPAKIAAEVVGRILKDLQARHDLQESVRKEISLKAAEWSEKLHEAQRQAADAHRDLTLDDLMRQYGRPPGQAA